MPLASIVIPVWNRFDGLERAVRSVLAQTEPDLEVIVVDGGSDDPAGAASVVGALGDARVRLVRLDQNRGPSAGRNAGVAVAAGGLVGFLDSDDELRPSWLEAMAAPFADARCAVVTCGVTISDRAGASFDTMPVPHGTAHHGVRARFLAGTMLVRADVLRAVGCYDEELWFGENSDLGLRLAEYAHRNGLAVTPVDEALFVWHRDQHGKAYSRRRMEGAERMLAKHAEAWQRDPAERCALLAVAGVNAARLGEYRRARRHFRRLLRAQPSMRTLGRLLAASVPPVTRRVWRGT